MLAARCTNIAPEDPSQVVLDLVSLAWRLELEWFREGVGANNGSPRRSQFQKMESVGVGLWSWYVMKGSMSLGRFVSSTAIKVDQGGSILI